jgi:hypothetical protein
MGPELAQRAPQPGDKPTNSIGCAVSKRPLNLNVNSLYGSPLLQELVNLSTATVAYHVAAGEGLKFTPPAEVFRTTANIQELVRFAVQDTSKPHIVMYAREVLRRVSSFGATSELDFAKVSVSTYCDMQKLLAANCSWSMPTSEDVLKRISNACSRSVTFEELKRIGKAGDPGDITNASMGARPADKTKD